MRPQVTEEQLKSLKLFAVYLNSYGAETASKEYYIESCSIDWTNDYFESPDTSIPLQTYEKINEVLDEIIETNELIERATTDCDLRGQLTIEIDCVNRIFMATAMQWEYSTDGRSDSKTLEEISQEFTVDMYNEVLRVFEQIGEDGEGLAKFQGGGDSGALDDYMEINGSDEKISPLLENMLYQWLENTGIDWYNNEGGQGSFLFDPKNSEIILEIEVNYEEAVDVPLNFEIRF
jgi:hypothetical protein